MQENKDIVVAKTAIDREVEALEIMKNELDENFTKALDVLQACKGRVIVTGMGKSGHVGRKISATFASTGTPSFFVHPGEASHGDLGMIADDDVVIAISNGGESKELSDILTYVLFGCWIIGCFLLQSTNIWLGKMFLLFGIFIFWQFISCCFLKRKFDISKYSFFI